MTAIYTPPGFDRRALLARVRSAELADDPRYRRWITRTSPLLFACTYLMDYLRGDETAGRVSLSQLHIDMARAARRWVRDDIGPGEIRDAWIAPRGSAKTVWACLILPLWAMAHEHPVGRFVHIFSDTTDQARLHLRSLRDELERNPLLQFDFPELCAGVPGQRRADLFVARSGVVAGAAGLGKSTLGVRVGTQRPTLLAIDDPEPEQADYDSTTKQDRLSAITNKVLPMALNAPLSWTGTTTVHGGLAHDLVRAAAGVETAEWIRETGVRARFYPAIDRDEYGAERSLWPERWSLEWLQSIRGTRMYAMNYGLMPPDAEHGYWSPADVRVVPDLRVGPRVLTVDPAATHGAKADFTGLSVTGREPRGVGADDARRVIVDYARGLRVSPDGLRRVVRGLLERNRSIRRVRVEKNQGGETWRAVLAPVVDDFPGVELDLFHTSDGKDARFTTLLDWYQRGLVVHGRELPELTEQQLAYPNVAHDDVLDAACAGVEHWLSP